MTDRKGPETFQTPTRLLLTVESPPPIAMQYLKEWFRFSVDRMDSNQLEELGGREQLKTASNTVFNDELVYHFFSKQWLRNNDEQYWSETRVQQDFYALEAFRNALTNISAANYSRQVGIPLRDNIFGSRGLEEIDLLVNYGTAVEELLTEEFRIRP